MRTDPAGDTPPQQRPAVPTREQAGPWTPGLLKGKGAAGQGLLLPRGCAWVPTSRPIESRFQTDRRLGGKGESESRRGGRRVRKDSSHPRSTDRRRPAGQPAAEMPSNATAAAPAPGLAQPRGSDPGEGLQACRGGGGPWRMAGGPRHHHLRARAHVPHGPGPQKASAIRRAEPRGSAPLRLINGRALQAPTVVGAVPGLRAGAPPGALPLGLEEHTEPLPRLRTGSDLGLGRGRG